MTTQPRIISHTTFFCVYREYVSNLYPFDPPEKITARIQAFLRVSRRMFVSPALADMFCLRAVDFLTWCWYKDQAVANQVQGLLDKFIKNQEL